MTTFLSNTLTQQGFTLLEVLIAMAISSVIYMGSYSLLDSVVTTEERVSDQRVILENTQRAFHVMQKDFEQIISRSVRGEFGEKSNPVEYNSIDQKLELTHLGWRNPIGRTRSNMQRVAYSIEDNILYREHWNVLDRVSESEAKKNQVLAGVSNLKFRFYANEQWNDDWNKEPSDKQILPQAIEVTFNSDRYGELSRIFILVNNPLDKLGKEI